MLVPDELGEELLLEPVPELELPMPLLLGEVELLPDVLGDELLGELLLGELLLDVPPLEELELLPDLLKWASHSCREIEPSPFLSTDENVGVELLELLAPPEALGEDDEEDELGEAALGEDEELLLGEDELLEAPPEALPEDLLSVALGLEELLLPVLPVLCAAATPASAKSAAAVAVTTTFNFIWIPPRRVGERELQPGAMQSPCPHKGPVREFLHTRRTVDARPKLTVAACAALVVSQKEIELQRLGSASPCATIPAAQMRRPTVASASTVSICWYHPSS